MANARWVRALGTDDWQTFRTVVCWVFSIVSALSGFVWWALADGWLNDQIAGAVEMAGGILLLPPVLSELRSRLAFARPVFAPVIFAWILYPLALAISAPFVPSAAEQIRLQQTAMVDAVTRLNRQDFAGASFALRKFADRANGGKPLGALLARIANSEKAKNVQAAKAPAPINTDLPVLAEKPQEPADAYVERVKTYWLPEVRAIPDTPPDEDAAFGKLLSQIDQLALNVEDGERLVLTPAQRLVRSELIYALRKKETRLLPAMRERYAKTMDAKLFRDDVRVTVSGPGNTTLRFTGATFSLNANVEDMQQSMTDVLQRLRFRRVEYRWSRFINDGSHYQLNPPADAAIGRWQNGEFDRVDRLSTAAPVAATR